MTLNQSHCVSDTNVVNTPISEAGGLFLLHICLYFSTIPDIHELIFFKIPLDFPNLDVKYEMSNEENCQEIPELKALTLNATVTDYANILVTLASTKFRDFLEANSDLHGVIFYPRTSITDFSDDTHQVEAKFVLDEYHKSSLIEASVVYTDHLKLYIPKFGLVASLQRAPLTVIIENNGDWKTSITAYINISNTSTECKPTYKTDPQMQDSLSQMVESLLAIICSTLSMAALIACLVTHLGICFVRRFTLSTRI
jgi:hypothetical protein